MNTARLNICDNIFASVLILKNIIFSAQDHHAVF